MVRRVMATSGSKMLFELFRMIRMTTMGPPAWVKYRAMIRMIRMKILVDCIFVPKMHRIEVPDGVQAQFTAP